jgi:hypothetical protein
MAMATVSKGTPHSVADPADPDPAKLLGELGQDRLQPGAFDGETEIPYRGGPEVGLVKLGGFGMHAEKI